ncbi:MAG: pyridoxal-phosphate dependent enzyme, partial [Gammaproteobacteria bacterium]|nr:pyridoxal-phosphate dependent enzyme [Gammaproteobacteria bacterium]
MAEYLERILKARVYDVAIETPLDPAPRLSARLANEILLKREDLQPVFSFKLRGAYNKLAQLTPAERAAGVICSSAGNHGQGVALAGRTMGIRAVIVMPTTTPTIKSEAVRALGGEVVLHGITYDDAYARARELVAAEG